MKTYKTSEEKYVKDNYFIIIEDYDTEGAVSSNYLVTDVNSVDFDKIREIAFDYNSLEENPFEGKTYGDFVDGGKIVSANEFIDEYFIKAKKNPNEYSFVTVGINSFDGVLSEDSPLKFICTPVKVSSAEIIKTPNGNILYMFCGNNNPYDFPMEPEQTEDNQTDDSSVISQ